MPEVPNELKILRAEINARLEEYAKDMPGAFGIPLSAHGGQAIQIVREFALRPGKRLRGALAMVAYRMFGGTTRQTALDLALAVELAQDYLLIIDDVMDRSDTRRGLATVHRQYYDLLKRDGVTSNREHIGNLLAVSVGLLAQHLSARVLSEIDDDPRRLIRAQQLFQTNIAVTGLGQMDDLINQAYERFTLEGTRQMYVLKSAYYTFVNPLQLGAVLAGAGGERLDALREFGEHAGLAFQLQDDLLGMFGNETATGKSSMDDMREGKMTLLVRHALAHADAGQLKQLRTMYGNAHATSAQHAQISAVLTATGSRSYVAREAQRAAEAAQDMLSAQKSWDVQGKQCLSDLLNYTINRGE
jgi:geranylgeranyl diphosphate synthase, type I